MAHHPLTRFIGRRRELGQLAALFGGGERLVTLWGPGGIGKTRLALAHAAGEERVTVCELADTRRPEGFAAAVADAIGLPLGAGESVTGAIDRLGRALRARGEQLLLLDNLEQIVDVAADAVARGVRGATPRQATLRRTIDWSWELLDDAERAALAQASVFRGGFLMDAACAVLAIDGLDPAEAVAALRDKSLLRRLPGPTARFGMLEAIGDYAAERLTDAGAARRHAEHYLRDGDAGAARGGPDAMQRLLAEQDNVTAVLDRALDGELPPDCALRAVLALEPLFTTRGPYELYDGLLDRALAVAPDETADRCQALRARGRTRQLRGLHAEARQDLEAALDAARRVGDRRAEGDALADLGVVHHQLRELDAAQRCYEAALVLLGGDARAEGRLRGNLGAVHHDAGRVEQARADYHRALALLEGAGDRRLLGIFLANLALLEQERGATGDAQAHLEDAVGCLEAVSDQRLLAVALGNLGMLLHEQGAPEEALLRHERARELLLAVGDDRSLGLCLGRLAAAYAATGDGARARRHLDAGLRTLGRLGEPLALATVRLTGAFLDLLRHAEQGGEHHMASARSRKEDARAAGQDGHAPSETSDDVRTLLRILARAVEQAGGPVLVLGPEARWFVTPDGETHDMARRSTLRRILLRLAERATLTLDDVLEAGWPGERVDPESGANRAHVALATLRGMGLREHLLRRDDGYVLDPALIVRLANAG